MASEHGGTLVFVPDINPIVKDLVSAYGTRHGYAAVSGVYVISSDRVPLHAKPSVADICMIPTAVEDPEKVIAVAVDVDDASTSTALSRSERIRLSSPHETTGVPILEKTKVTEVALIMPELQSHLPDAQHGEHGLPSIMA